MSPISAEMNGNVSTELNSSSNSNTSKGLLEEANNSSSESSGNNAMGLNNLSGSSGCSSGHGGGPMTSSTPLADQSYSEGTEEQPTSSTEGNFGFSAPKFGTLIPNRVFVGGISCHTTESELNLLFSRFGCVKGTKIIMDRAGVSKGYGFVTFETEEEAKRLFSAMNNREMPPIVHRDRRLNIAPAVKKQNFELLQPSGRQNAYSSSGSTSGGASSAFSPPPFDTPGGYYFQNMNGQHGQEFFGPPVSIPDNYFPQSNGFQSTPVHSGSQPYYATIPTLGQALTGPNGGLFFVPISNFPYQQNLTGPEQWNGGMNSGSTFNSNLNSQSQWRFMNPTGAGLPLSLQGAGGAGSYGCGSLGGGAGSLGSPPHHFMQDHLLAHPAAGSAFPSAGHQDSLFYYNAASALISSPH